MDKVIESVVRSVDPGSQSLRSNGSDGKTELNSLYGKGLNDTIIFVVGDHGMTSDGNHGGATAQETNAGMFIYSTSEVWGFSPSFSVPGRDQSRKNLFEGHDHASVSQVSLVPTLSLLLGLPIPFGNLGSVIPELFLGLKGPSSPRTQGKTGSLELDQLLQLLEAIHINAGQVFEYLEVYSRQAVSLPQDHMETLSRQFQAAKDKYLQSTTAADAFSHSMAASDVTAALALREAIVSYQKWLDDALDMCRHQWTMFDTVAMHAGLMLLVLASTLGFFVVAFGFSSPISDQKLVSSSVWGSLRLGVIITLTWTTLRYFCDRLSIDHSALMIQGVTIGAAGTLISEVFQSVHFRIQACFLVNSHSPKTLILAISSHLKNYISRFGIAAAIMFCIYSQGLFSNSFIVNEHRVSIFLACSCCILLMLLDIINAQSQTKEEPENTNFPKWTKYIAASLCIRFMGEGQGFSPETRLHWMQTALGFGPKHFSVSSVQQYFSTIFESGNALLGFGFVDELKTLVAMALLWFLFSCFRTSKGGSNKVLWSASAASTIGFWILPHDSSQHLSEQVFDAHNTLARIVYVCALLGLVKTMSSCVCTRHKKYLTEDAPAKRFTDLEIHTHSFIGFIMAPAIIVTGPKSAMVYLLLGLFYFAFASAARRNPMNVPHSSGLNALECVLLFFVSNCAFFSLGHRNDIGTLPANSAFVGFSSFNYYIAGGLMGLNVFGSFFLTMLAIPFTIFSRAADVSRAAQPVSKTASHDAVFACAARQVLHATTCVCLLYFARACLSAVNVYLQRRHLMVWAIFAPKFLFDVVASMVITAITLAIGTICVFNGSLVRQPAKAKPF